MKVYLILFIFSLLSCNKSTSADDIQKFKLHPISSLSAQNHITNSDVTFLEVGSETCYSCQIMGKNIEDVKNQKPDFNVVFVDIYKDPTGLSKFNVRSIPTQIVLNNRGNELYRHIGVLETNQILEAIKKYNIRK